MPDLATMPIPAARVLINPMAGPVPGSPPDRAPLTFHAQLAGYAPTPLIDAPDLARLLGVGRVWVKDDSSRLGLPAFKILGASWAACRALHDHLGGAFDPALTLDALRDRLAPRLPLALAAATDGNHGRAVARIARLLGLDAHIFVPIDMAQARQDAIASEGATVTVVDGTYDEAVALAATHAGPRCLVIADTSWEGYEDVPRWVIDGYATILWEVDDDLARRGEPGPDLVAAQMGVGALAAAVARHYRRPALRHQPRLVGVEPADAACILASAAAGQPTEVPGPHRSIMAGLNCGLPSPVAWPVVSAAYDVFAAIDDDWAREAMRALAAAGVVAGETGAAGLGGLLALLADPRAAATRAALGVTPETRVLLLNTEGATDPGAYLAITGREAALA